MAQALGPLYSAPHQGAIRLWLSAPTSARLSAAPAGSRLNYGCTPQRRARRPYERTPQRRARWPHWPTTIARLSAAPDSGLALYECTPQRRTR